MQGKLGYAETAVRAAWHCGWMAEEDWTPGKADLPPRFAENEPYDLDVCPGWLVRQEPVIEISRAYNAYERGELSTFYPQPPNWMAEGVQELSASMSRFSAERLKRSKESHG